MFCPYCGAENQEQNKFCMKCGKPLPSAPPAERKTTGASLSKVESKTGRGSRAPIGLLVRGAAVLAVVLVGLLAISWLSSSLFGGRSGASVPRQVKHDMVLEAVETHSRHDIFRRTSSMGNVFCSENTLKITGRGEAKPVEQGWGVDKVVCYRVYMDCTEDDVPYTEVYHGLALRTGDAWEFSILTPSEETWWKEHSCPGEFEPADEHYRMYRDR